MKTNHYVLFVAFFGALLVTSQTAAVPAGSSETKKFFGQAVRVGNGSAHTYVELKPDGSPLRLGVVVNKRLLQGLPSTPNKIGRCFEGRCLDDYETVLLLPKQAAKIAKLSIHWVALDWNPEGHGPPAPAPWAAPHFDFHFYIMSRDAVQAIRPGPCAELINCEDFKRATLSVAPKYLPKHHIDVGAAVQGMGNHLIDSTTPELGNPPQKFTHTFIYGAYDGHITFYEAMIARQFLLSQPNTCKSLNLPEAWEMSGYYPAEYCIHYQKNSGEYNVSLEKFIYREAQ